MQDGHKDLSWFGQKKALHPAGGESLYYLAPKCLYKGIQGSLDVDSKS
jgi:hypothetical protein